MKHSYKNKKFTLIPNNPPYMDYSLFDAENALPKSAEVPKGQRGKAAPMNENDWFDLHQPLLLEIVNTDEGRLFFNIDDYDLEIILITKSKIKYFMGINLKGKAQYLHTIYVRDHFSRIIRKNWLAFQKLAQDIYRVELNGKFLYKPLLKYQGELIAAAATNTYYPDPDPESNTVDGYITHNDYNITSTWEHINNVETHLYTYDDDSNNEDAQATNGWVMGNFGDGRGWHHRPKFGFYTNDVAAVEEIAESPAPFFQVYTGGGVDGVHQTNHAATDYYIAEHAGNTNHWATSPIGGYWDVAYFLDTGSFTTAIGNSYVTDAETDEQLTVGYTLIELEEKADIASDGNTYPGRAAGATSYNSTLGGYAKYELTFGDNFSDMFDGSFPSITRITALDLNYEAPNLRSSSAGDAAWGTGSGGGASEHWSISQRYSEYGASTATDPRLEFSTGEDFIPKIIII